MELRKKSSIFSNLLLSGDKVKKQFDIIGKLYLGQLAQIIHDMHEMESKYKIQLVEKNVIISDKNTELSKKDVIIADKNTEISQLNLTIYINCKWKIRNCKRN